jgi:hypothetical protein
MRRRSRAGGEPVKTRRRKTLALKSDNAPTASGRGAPDPGQDAEMARIVRERDQALEQLSEALEQQTATSEVLRVISSSPGDLEPVFRAMLENAIRICDAKFGVLYLYEGGKFRSAALANPSPEFEAFLKERGEFVPDPRTGIGRIVEMRQTVHIVASEATGRW